MVVDLFIIRTITLNHIAFYKCKLTHNYKIMATMTNEQIEAKKLQLKQLAEEAKQLKDELVEAGAWPLDEDDLDQAAGGFLPPKMYYPGSHLAPPTPQKIV